MIKQIKRKECLKKYPIFPQRNFNKDTEDYDYLYPDRFSNYVLALKSETYKKHLKNLGKELLLLCTALKSSKFIFLGDEKLAWRFREGKYKNFKKGMEYLASEGIKKTFAGGLIVGEGDMVQFVKHLTVLISVNGIIPYVHFTDESQHIVGSICKDGNIHITTVDSVSDNLFMHAVSATKFNFLTGACYPQFDINGRKPKLS
ncbi:hypothetical protein ACS5PU_04795 [Pedobacter sp. GSP4]|uniref:hypothetical protein n=1 Tax=Pedobacter sp. GSP4 TaxID=3453716 RepID=UPI003EEE0265